MEGGRRETVCVRERKESEGVPGREGMGDERKRERVCVCV